MFKRTKVCSAVLVAFGGTLALGAAPAFGQQTLERVEITGSSIKRIDVEGARRVDFLPNPGDTCIGCHSVSRDGRQLAGFLEGTGENLALYDLTRDELRYILDPADVMGDDYPSETFRVLKKNEIREFGEYRTGRLVLEAWDRLPGLPK